MRMNRLYLVLLCYVPVVFAQVEAERWSIHAQATSIGQTHGAFASPYEGANSLPAHREDRVSLTSTLFLAYRLGHNTELVVNPEIAGGKGFGEVTGIAGFPNGEIPRVASATPKLYPARAFLRSTWAIGNEKQLAEDGVNQLAGEQPVTRFTWVLGKFAATDFFDANSYSHDPRSQFMNWSLMCEGAWDYPADTRGYTIGSFAELTMRKWSLRTAAMLEPTEANGPTFDTRVGRNRGEALEWERRYKPFGHSGVVRFLGFLNQEDAGTFRQAMLPGGATDLQSTRRNGTKKYGAGVNLEQQITESIGVFARYGWSDGKTESWAFTQIDRSLSGGTSVRGCLWKRAADHIGVGAVRNQLAGDHRSFLAAGGLGFIIGDGRLNYRPETIVETYYSFRVNRALTLTADYQKVENPGYNHDRGPVSVYSMRVHLER
jgi:high affinity Mn2+ porin